MLLLCISFSMKIIVRPKEWWYKELLRINKMNLSYCGTITIVSIIIVNSILVSLGDNFQLTVLHTNDIHSRIEQTNKYLGVCKPKDRSKFFTIHYKFCYFTYEQNKSIAQITMYLKIKVVHITYRKGTTSMFWRCCKVVQHCQGNQDRWRKCNFLKWGWYVSGKCLVQSIQMESDRPVHKLFEFYSFSKYITKESQLNNFLHFKVAK